MPCHDHKLRCLQSWYRDVTCVNIRLNDMEQLVALPWLQCGNADRFTFVSSQKGICGDVKKICQCANILCIRRAVIALPIFDCGDVNAEPVRELSLGPCITLPEFAESLAEVCIHRTITS
ncbi:MAG: hypothetical protein Q4E53_05990 [Eubacteriales bacterium]|nr:hypothetical protein [Eubacteriales bacterium]